MTVAGPGVLWSCKATCQGRSGCPMRHPFFCSRKTGCWHKPRLSVEAWPEDENHFALKGVSRLIRYFKIVLRSYLITSVDVVEELRLILVLGANGASPLSLAQSSVNGLKLDLFFYFEKNQIWLLNAFGEGTVDFSLNPLSALGDLHWEEPGAFETWRNRMWCGVGDRWSPKLAIMSWLFPSCVVWGKYFFVCVVFLLFRGGERFLPDDAFNKSFFIRGS